MAGTKMEGWERSSVILLSFQASFGDVLDMPGPCRGSALRSTQPKGRQPPRAVGPKTAPLRCGDHQKESPAAPEPGGQFPEAFHPPKSHQVPDRASVSWSCHVSFDPRPRE